MKYLVVIIIAVLFQFNSLFSQIISENLPNSIKGDYKYCKRIESFRNDTKISEGKYNEIGLLIEENIYDKQNYRTRKYNYFYNENNALIQKTEFNFKDSTIFNYYHKYNERGKEIEYIETINDSLYQKVIYIYDDNDKLLEKRQINENGELSIKIISIYDKSKNLIKSISYIGNVLNTTVEYIYSK